MYAWIQHRTCSNFNSPDAAHHFWRMSAGYFNRFGACLPFKRFGACVPFNRFGACIPFNRLGARRQGTPYRIHAVGGDPRTATSACSLALVKCPFATIAAPITGPGPQPRSRTTPKAAILPPRPAPATPDAARWAALISVFKPASSPSRVPGGRTVNSPAVV